MYLKSLTLKGFKSFADRTPMAFDPGLSVIVGPNGSGKSNVSDAILWVLGEQSAKQLRGQAMEDVIFSGSSARQAVGLAEVTLVLDNTDRLLPIDFTEVAITRRMFRSGESEYLINQSPARLMDIQDILHDTGLGKDTHSIISQGKLDSVLASRPEDRRALIEEAADISKHRRRKERSQRKIANMDKNLVRAKDIAREVNRQLRPLERQVDRAKKAAEITERLTLLTTTLAVDDLRRLQGEMSTIETRTNEAAAAVELARHKVREKSDELERLQKMLEEKGLYVGDLDAQRRRAQNILSSFDSDLRLLAEKSRNMESRVSEMRSSVETTQLERRNTQEEIASAKSELAETRRAVELLAGEVEELTPAAEAALTERAELEERYSKLASELRETLSTADAETLAYAKLRDAVSGAEAQDQLFANRISQLEEAFGITSGSLDEWKGRITATEAALADIRSRQEELTGRSEQLKVELEASRASEDTAREELSRARASLSALEAVDEAAEAASPLIAALTHDEKSSGLIRERLGDLIEVPSELEGVVERLLGSDLLALVVDDRSSLESLAHSALAHVGEGGTATLAAKTAAGAAAGAVSAPNRLIDRLTVSEEFLPLIEALIGDVCLADSISDALSAAERHPGTRQVSRDGATVYPDGRITVGSEVGAETGALERKRQIRSLKHGMDDLEAALANAEKASVAKQDELSSTTDELAKLTGDSARLEGELLSATAEVGRLGEQIDANRAEKLEVERKRTEASEKMGAARPELEQHKAAADAANTRAGELSHTLDELAATRERAQSAEQEATAKLSDARLRHATNTERVRYLESRISELGYRLSELDDRSAAVQGIASALSHLTERVDPLRGRLQALRDAAAAEAARLADRANLEEADSSSLKKTINDARREVSEASSALERAQESENALRVSEGRLEVQVETAIARIVDTGYSLDEALELPEPEDRELMEGEASDLEGKLARIGPVNQVAMEEYSRLRERADLIAEQVDDLERARKALARITAAIDRKMRDKFVSTYEQVNRYFQEIFAVLFPGGKAHLELTDPDNPSESGIEVVAQPKGKRLAKMTLLSGGEKSLTALALLFAVYRTRTVPFYVFDEVEAALDDANLDRLLHAIDSLKDTTQLIVISHQRRTMEKADVLYGVSMQADGVSRVVSQKLDPETGKVVDS